MFDDYIDVTECGAKQLVLRVYESCDLPVMIRISSMVENTNGIGGNLSNNFARWYYWRLNEYIIMEIRDRIDLD